MQICDMNVVNLKDILSYVSHAVVSVGSTWSTDV